MQLLCKRRQNKVLQEKTGDVKEILSMTMPL